MKFKIYILLILMSLKMVGQQKVEVFFDFNEDFPNANSVLELNKWIAINKNAEIHKLWGFCDSIDTKSYNKDLAKRRIENVQKLLEVSGIKLNDSIEKVAYGKEFKQSKVQAENRKVVVFYFEQKPKIKESAFLLKIKSSKKGEIIALPDINFYNNTARILPKSKKTLLDLLCALEDNPNLKIEIRGHICCQKEFDPSGLSTNRARVIYSYLIRNKIDRKRLKFKGYGTSQPLHPIPEKNILEEEENRRVEIMIIEN